MLEIRAVSSAKWTPVRVKKTRQNKKIERDRDSIQNKRALDRRLGFGIMVMWQMGIAHLY
jgi:hypothetical protein